MFGGLAEITGWKLEASDQVQAVRIVSRVAAGTRMHLQIEEQMIDGSQLRRPVSMVWEHEGWKIAPTDLGVGVDLDSSGN